MISVICPAYNEAEHIEDILRFFVGTEPAEKELLIIDGGSTDGTRELVEKWCEKYQNIRLLRNPNRTVPFALNIGIRESSGDPIVRIDAHSKYAEDYFLKIIKTFNETRADIVGGPTRTAGKTLLQEAVGSAISNPFGTGSSKVHNFEYKGFSDSVTFGAWRRSLFDEIGYFDERLHRNQDDEFHYRANSRGKKVYLNPEIKLWYYPRSSIKGLFKQYYQYGYYKPLVLLKVKSEIKLRHLIPSLFAAYILTIPLIYFSLQWLFPLILYLILSLLYGLKGRGRFSIRILSAAIFPVIHLAYGFGFLAGLLKLNKLKKGGRGQGTVNRE